MSVFVRGVQVTAHYAEMPEGLRHLVIVGKIKVGRQKLLVSYKFVDFFKGTGAGGKISAKNA